MDHGSNETDPRIDPGDEENTLVRHHLQITPLRTPEHGPGAPATGAISVGPHVRSRSRNRNGALSFGSPSLRSGQHRDPFPRFARESIFRKLLYTPGSTTFRMKNQVTLSHFSFSSCFARGYVLSLLRSSLDFLQGDAVYSAEGATAHSSGRQPRDNGPQTY